MTGMTVPPAKTLRRSAPSGEPGGARSGSDRDRGRPQERLGELGTESREEEGVIMLVFMWYSIESSAPCNPSLAVGFGAHRMASTSPVCFASSVTGVSFPSLWPGVQEVKAERGAMPPKISASTSSPLLPVRARLSEQLSC